MGEIEKQDFGEKFRVDFGSDDKREAEEHRSRSASDASEFSDVDIEAQNEVLSGPQDTIDGNSAPNALRPSISRASSIRQPAVIVPRSERRGLFARFTVIPEVTIPHDYTNSVKWMITAIVAIAAAAAPMGSAIIMPALGPIAKELHSTPTITNLSVALYMLSMSIFPLWWSSFSETLGRRTIYIVSFAFFVVFGILSAVAKNIAMLIVMRMLSGGAAASVQAVGAGTIADLWEPRERGRAMGLFYLGPLSGPLVAPVIGGVMAEGLGWRSTLWLLAIFGSILEVFIIICLPETLRKRRSLVPEAEREAVSRPAGKEAYFLKILLPPYLIPALMQECRRGFHTGQCTPYLYSSRHVDSASCASQDEEMAGCPAEVSHRPS